MARRLLARVPGARSAAHVARRARIGLSRTALEWLSGLVPPRAAMTRTLEVVRRRPEQATAQAIELVTSLTQSLRAASDPGAGNRWLHHRWLALFDEMMTSLGHEVPAAPFHAVSLGAGTANPLALPLLLFLAGAERVWVVEPGLADADEEWRRRWGLEELALRVLTGDVHSSHFRRAPADMQRFADLRDLFFGTTLTGALNPDTVRIVPDYVEDARIPPCSVHLATSRSVLEHVADTGRCFDALSAMMAPGGVMLHWIDLSAHDDGDPFALYYDATAVGGRADGLNGLRLNDYLDAFTRRGFAVRVVDRTLEPGYDLRRRPLLPRYAGYAEDDLRCRRAVIVARAGEAR